MIENAQTQLDCDTVKAPISGGVGPLTLFTTLSLSRPALERVRALGRSSNPNHDVHMDAHGPVKQAAE